MASRILAAVIACAMAASAPAVSAAGTGLSLGKAGAFLESLASGKVGAGSTWALPAPGGEELLLEVQDFHFQDGYLAMSGAVRGSAGSEFIFKGEASDLYGWAALKDRKTAFEYTTDAAGQLSAETVPLSKIFSICDGTDDPSQPAPPPSFAASAEQGVPAQAAGPEPHVGPYPAGVDVRKLQSLPGATKVLWMNMARITNNGEIMGWTKAQIWEIWQGFAAGFSMYKVNVTTDSTVWAAAGVRNGGIANMYNESGRSSCALNAFGTSRGCTVYRKSTAKYNAGTLIHEVGHLLGLSHDGSPNGEYYGGFSAYQWVPVMGNHTSGLSWGNTLWQWSKGEYNTANQKQDDLAIMAAKLEYRADDSGGIVPLKLTGDSVTALLNRGQINRNTDVDTFSFRIVAGGGRAKLRVDRTEYFGGSMLDVEAQIIDSEGKQVIRSNVAAARYASFDQALPGGTYRLVVKGGAEGSSANGFSNYSSMGFYAVSGTVTGGVVGLAAGDGFDRAVQVSRFGSSVLLHLRLPPGAKIRGISLSSVRGEKVFESRSALSTVDLTPFPAGYYGLRIDMDGATVVRRIARL